MKKFLLTVLYFAFMAISSYAQDTVYKTDGTKIEGSVKIQINDRNDLVSIRNIKIDASEIERIILEDGSVITSKKLTYYSSRFGYEITKYALLTSIFEGSADLYKYNWKDFTFALQVDGETFALQELPLEVDTEVIQTYKIVLLINLEECAPRPDIFAARYNQKSLVKLVNRFERCKRGIPEKISTEDLRERSSNISFSLGLNHATHSLEARANAIVNGELRQVGEIKQLHKASNSLSFDLFFQQRIAGNKNLFLQFGTGYRKFDFKVTTLNNTVSVDNLTQSEAHIDLAFNIKILPKKRFTPEFSIGGFYWTFLNPKNLYNKASDEVPVLNSNSYKKNGFGLFYQIFLNYSVNDTWNVFFSVKHLIRIEDHIFTNKITETQLRRLYNDTLHINFLFSFGTSFSISRNKIY